MADNNNYNYNILCSGLFSVLYFFPFRCPSHSFLTCHIHLLTALRKWFMTFTDFIHFLPRSFLLIRFLSHLTSVPTFLSCLSPSVCLYFLFLWCCCSFCLLSNPSPLCSTVSPSCDACHPVAYTNHRFYMLYTCTCTHTPSCYQPLVFAWICPVFYLTRSCASSLLSSLLLLINTLYPHTSLSTSLHLSSSISTPPL